MSPSIALVMEVMVLFTVTASLAESWKLKTFICYGGFSMRICKGWSKSNDMATR
jgi:hypothetical protein